MGECVIPVALAVAWQRADHVNSLRIETAFADIIERYSEVAHRRRLRSIEGTKV